MSKTYFYFLFKKNKIKMFGVLCLAFLLLRPKPNIMFWAIFGRTCSMAEYSVHPYSWVFSCTLLIFILLAHPFSFWNLEGRSSYGRCVPKLIGYTLLYTSKHRSDSLEDFLRCGHTRRVSRVLRVWNRHFLHREPLVYARITRITRISRIKQHFTRV